MIDERIVIDGVDISKCEFLTIIDDKRLCRCIKADLFGGIEFVENAKNGNCKDNPNCLYKKFKRTERELNDYKKQFKADTKEMEDYQNEITRHLESMEYWQYQAEAKEQECETLLSQLDFEVQKKECLEQECEELKERFKNFHDRKLDESADLLCKLHKEECLKFKAEQKLEKIKEFATALCYTVMSDGVVILQRDILKIIDEVE